MLPQPIFSFENFRNLDTIVKLKRVQRLVTYFCTQPLCIKGIVWVNMYQKKIKKLSEQMIKSFSCHPSTTKRDKFSQLGDYKPKKQAIELIKLYVPAERKRTTAKLSSKRATNHL